MSLVKDVLFFFFLNLFWGRTSRSCSVVRFLKITFLPLGSRHEYKRALFPLPLKEKRNKGREIILYKEACLPRARQNKEPLFVLAFAEPVDGVTCFPRAAWLGRGQTPAAPLSARPRSPGAAASTGQTRPAAAPSARAAPLA